MIFGSICLLELFWNKKTGIMLELVKRGIRFILALDQNWNKFMPILLFPFSYSRLILAWNRNEEYDYVFLF